MKTEKILIYPFVFHSGDGTDLSFLEKGISRMLHTRLRHENRTETVFVQPAGQLPENPVEGGILYGADYVLTGSITMFGSRISTDALLYSVRDKKEVLSFGEFGQNEGDAIEHINNLAIKVNLDIFGIDTRPYLPEQQMASHRSYGQDTLRKFGSPNALVMRSRNFDHEIRSIAVGDINGDGFNEIVFATQTSIRVIQFQNGKETLIAEKSISKFHSIIRIDVFDFNGNGRDEIIITASNSREPTNISVAFEMTADNTFRELSISSGYFYALQYDNGQPILAAQSRRGKGAFDRKAYHVDVTDNGFSVSNRLFSLPKNSSIYSFASGDIFNNNTVAYAAYLEAEGVQFLDDAFRERSAKTGEYGKSIISFLTTDDMTAKRDQDNYPHYISQRILIADMNNDGKNEIIVVENDEGATSFISRLRAFKWGKVSILSWDDQQKVFITAWESEPYAGGIIDINVGDITGNGKKELVLAVNPSAKNLVTFGAGQQSYIVVKGF